MSLCAKTPRVRHKLLSLALQPHNFHGMPKIESCDSSINYSKHVSEIEALAEPQKVNYKE